MPGQKSSFIDRLYDEWLPSFCEAPHRNLSIDGFKHSSIENLDSFDAEWFLRAIDIGLVTESGGFFVAPQSKAKEQIFWTGRKAISPRPITLWIEPIITVGTIARLHEQYDWPMNNLGMQSETWAFDLVCYDNSLNQELLVCEVKKSNKEIEALLSFMDFYCLRDSLTKEPVNSKEKNAYRKIQGIRKTWPQVFWALGPSGKGYVYQIHMSSDSQCFHMESVSDECLKFKC